MTVSLAQIDAEAAEQIDALPGWKLFYELQRKWFQEGVTIWQSGHPISECWSHAHRCGWRTMQRVMLCVESLQAEMSHA